MAGFEDEIKEGEIPWWEEDTGTVPCSLLLHMDIEGHCSSAEQEGASPHTPLWQHPSLGHVASEIMKDKCLLLKALSLWNFVIVDQTH
jgi:hypothetical protein